MSVQYLFHCAGLWNINIRTGWQKRKPAVSSAATALQQTREMESVHQEHKATVQTAWSLLSEQYYLIWNTFYKHDVQSFVDY